MKGVCRVEEQVEEEEMEEACVWHKEHTHRLGTGLNQAGRGESDEFGMGFWLLGVCRYGQGERGHGESWSCGPGLSGLRSTELESGCESG